MEYKVCLKNFPSIDGSCLIKFKGLWPISARQIRSHGPSLKARWGGRDSWIHEPIFRYPPCYIIQSPMCAGNHLMLFPLSWMLKLIYSQCGLEASEEKKHLIRWENRLNHSSKWYIMCRFTELTDSLVSPMSGAYRHENISSFPEKKKGKAMQWGRLDKLFIFLVENTNTRARRLGEEEKWTLTMAKKKGQFYNSPNANIQFFHFGFFGL